MRHDDAGQSGDSPLAGHCISWESSALVPGISRPYSSTHQHSVPLISLEHWIGSNSPDLAHFGMRTRGTWLVGRDSRLRDLARRVSA